MHTRLKPRESRASHRTDTQEQMDGNTLHALRKRCHCFTGKSQRNKIHVRSPALTIIAARDDIGIIFCRAPSDVADIAAVECSEGMDMSSGYGTPSSPISQQHD